MSVESFVDGFHGVVITTCSGEVTLGEVVSGAEALRKEPEFKPDFAHLLELSRVSGVRVDNAGLYEIWSVHDPFSNRHRRALVSPSAGAAHHAARIYRTLSASSNCEVFESLPDAIHWLGLHSSFLKIVADKASLSHRVESDSTELQLSREVPRSFRPAKARGSLEE